MHNAPMQTAADTETIGKYELIEEMTGHSLAPEMPPAAEPDASETTGDSVAAAEADSSHRDSSTDGPGPEPLPAPST